jgi:hypothetical protein
MVVTRSTRRRSAASAAIAAPPRASTSWRDEQRAEDRSAHGLGAQHERTEARANEPGVLRASDLVVREAALGADGEDDRLGRERRPWSSVTARLGTARAARGLATRTVTRCFPVASMLASASVAASGSNRTSGSPATSLCTRVV